MTSRSSSFSCAYYHAEYRSFYCLHPKDPNLSFRSSRARFSYIGDKRLSNFTPFNKMASASNLEQQQSASDAPPPTLTNNESPAQLPAEGLAKIPPFHNTKDQSARAFLDFLQSIKSTYKWDNTQTTNAAIAAFKGEARAWYEFLRYHEPKTFDTYESFEAAFLKRFKSNQNAAQQVKLFSNLYQRPDESVTGFMDRVDNALITICRDAMPRAQQKRAGAQHIIGHFAIIIFLNGLLSPIKSQIESNFTVDESSDYLVKRDILLDAAQRYEAGNRTNNQAAPVTVSAFSLRGHNRGRGRGAARGGTRTRYTRNYATNYNTPNAAYYNNAAQFPQVTRNTAATPPHIIATRKRWVKCNKCQRWGKHYAKECPYPAANVAEITTDQPPTDAIYDEHFDNLPPTSAEQNQTN